MNRGRERLAKAVLAAVSALFLVRNYTGDYGTHLAIGREVWRLKAIPAAEFLNAPLAGTPHQFTEWLFQLLLYGVQSAGGDAGVGILCWALASATIYFLHRAALVRGIDPLLSALALFAFAGFLRLRVQPRPEIFAFLFLSIVAWAWTERFFGTRKRAIYVIPPLAAVWANMHPTGILGIGLGGFFILDAAAHSLIRRELDLKRMREFLAPAAVTAVAYACTWLNPYGLANLMAPVTMASNQVWAMSITELAPVRDTALYPFVAVATAFGVCALVAGAWGRSLRLLDILLFAAAVKGAWMAVRGVFLLPLLLSPMVASQIDGALRRIGIRSEGEGVPGAQSRARGTSFRAAWVIAIAATAGMGIYSLVLSAGVGGDEAGVGLTPHRYSEGAARFVRDANPPGAIFNFFDIGGYLNWKLYPVKRTFIDGRIFEERVYMDYNTVVAGFDGWDRILERYGVTTVITPAIDSTGMVLPLIDRLGADRGWALAYADGLCLVFLKDAPGTRDIIRLHEIGKTRIHEEIVSEIRHAVALGVPEENMAVALGNALRSLGREREAEEAYRKAIAR